MSMSMPQRSTSWQGRTGRWPAWRRRMETPARALAISEVRDKPGARELERGNR